MGVTWTQMRRSTISRRGAARLIAGGGALLLARTARLRAAEAGPLIFAAASLRTALDRIAALWAEAGGAPTRISYAASSVLARQIERGAPAELFLSAHPRWTERLVARGALRGASRRVIATNRLALIAAPGQADQLAILGAAAAPGEIGAGLPLRAALGEGRLATARVESVPLGLYAKAALSGLGLWPQVADRLAEAQNARIALAFVARGEAPLGVVYATDARLAPEVRLIGLFPAASHPPILYPAALTADGAGSESARAFLAFLTSAPAQAVFRDLGFGDPAAPRP